jgi:pilus assembly protein CpaE
MGTYDLLTEHLKEAALRTSSRILVVASPAHIDALTQAAGAELIPGLRGVALESAAPLPADAMGEASILVIEVDPADRASMRRVGDVREAYPDLPVVAAIADASVTLVRTLVREGISDVVSLPFDLNELLQISLDAAAKHDAEANEGVALAPLVAVARSLGGCGATSILTHLAADLAEHDSTGRGVMVVDLDLQFGSVADYLGIQPKGTVADLLAAEDRLDEDLVRSVATEAGGAISVIAAPDTIMPLESIDTDVLLRMIRLLRRQYGYVLIDLPANWTNWALSAALAADSIVLVTELTIASLRQAKRRLDLFRSVGIEDRSVEVVVNRVEKRLFRAIGLDDVAETLGRPVLGSVTLEAPLVSTAQNQGNLVTQMHRKSKFAKDIAGIGALMRSGNLARRR